MEDRERYTVGEQIVHTSFGTGLVVEVRDRGFYDVLEVAFQNGVKRLTSIHPDILGRPGERESGGVATAVATGEATAAPLVETTAPSTAPPRKRTKRYGDWQGFQNPLIELAPASARLITRWKRGAPDAHRQARLKLKAEELAARLDPSELMAFDLARDVVRYSHQVDACRRVIGEMRGRALLADEVGLGKTIEAGVVLSELVIRGLVERALILVPASLQTQWAEELRQKFGLRFHVRKRGETFDCSPLLITTLDTARVKRNQDQILEQSYDMVIIDEAHRLKNHRTLSYGFANALSARYLLLLTATPVHNDLRELYNLVTLLRPGTLDTYSAFRKEFVARGDRRIPRNTAALAERLTKVMIRTRREETDITFPKRQARVVAVEPTPEETRLYAAVSELVRDVFHAPDLPPMPGLHLTLMTLQKEIGSSPQSAAPTLAKLARRCPQGALRGRAEELTEQARATARPAKLAHVVDELDQHRDKVLIFTQFRTTLEFLARELSERGHDVAVFHGSLPEAQREEAVRAFRSRSRIMVSTDAGGEGRNLQFCHRMINYDLPWNPMKLEQRIGRIHRLGQESAVTVINLAARGTLESYVLAILFEKLRMFELVVGELDMILGHVPESQSIEESIFKLWTMTDSGERESGFQRLGQGLENARLRHEMICELDRRIFDSIREGID